MPADGPDLGRAVDRGSLAEVVEALAAGADPDRGRLALRAVRRGDAAILEALLQAGADPGCGDSIATPLGTAAERGRDDLVRRLLAAGAPVDGTTQFGRGRPLALAAASARVEALVLLVRAGAEIDARNDVVIDGEAARETTALLAAARAGSAPAVSILLRAGADPQLRDEQGSTAFDWASRLQRADVLECLAAAGISQRRFTPAEALVRAAASGDVENLNAALAEAPVDARDERRATRGFTALMLAAEAGHLAAVERLLSAGADVRARDGEAGDARLARMMAAHAGPEALAEAGVPSGRAALHRAAGAGHLAVAEALLRAGADAGEPDFLGDGPLHLALRAGHLALVRRLQAAGAPPDAPGAGQETPLLLAAARGSADLAASLLEARANPNARAADGTTPLVRAASRADAALVRLLLDHGADPRRARSPANSPVLAAVSATRRVPLAQAPAEQRRITIHDDQGAWAQVSLLESQILETLEPLLSSGAAASPGLPTAAMNGMLEVVRRLVEAGADPQEREALELAEAAGRTEVLAFLRSARRGPAAPAPRQRTRARRRSTLPADFPLVDLAAAALHPAFRQVVADLAARCGSAAYPIEDLPGGYGVHLKEARRAGLDLAAVQAELLARGAFVFDREARDGGPGALVALPTTDRYVAVAAMGTNGANADVSTARIVEWLRELEAAQPFVLTTIGRDTLAGRFRTPVRNAARLARSMYRLCPDIVDQGTGTVALLAAELKQSGRLFLWWD